jgi:hypothetical protein
VIGKFAIFADATGGGLAPTLIGAIVTPIEILAVVLVFALRSRRGQKVAVREEGAVLVITTLATPPIRKQIDALRPSFGVGKGPRSGLQRPIALLDPDSLRLSLNGSAATGYLTIPRSAITSAVQIEVRDRLLRIAGIHLTIVASEVTCPLDLVPLDPDNPTRPLSPAQFTETLAKLQAELGLARASS